MDYRLIARVEFITLVDCLCQAAANVPAEEYTQFDTDRLRRAIVKLEAKHGIKIPDGTDAPMLFRDGSRIYKLVPVNPPAPDKEAGVPGHGVEGLAERVEEALSWMPPVPDDRQDGKRINDGPISVPDHQRPVSLRDLRGPLRDGAKDERGGVDDSWFGDRH